MTRGKFWSCLLQNSCLSCLFVKNRNNVTVSAVQYKPRPHGHINFQVLGGFPGSDISLPTVVRRWPRCQLLLPSFYLDGLQPPSRIGDVIKSTKEGPLDDSLCLHCNWPILSLFGISSLQKDCLWWVLTRNKVSNLWHDSVQLWRCRRLQHGELDAGYLSKLFDRRNKLPREKPWRNAFFPTSRDAFCCGRL